MSKIKLILVMWLSLLIGIIFNSCNKDEDNQTVPKSEMTDITDFSYSTNTCGSESAFTNMYQEPDEQMKQKHQFVSLYDGTPNSQMLFEAHQQNGDIISLVIDRSYSYQLSGWIRFSRSDTNKTYYSTIVKYLIYDTKCGSYLFVYEATNVAGYPNPDKNKFIIAYRLFYQDGILALQPEIKGQTFPNEIYKENPSVDKFYTKMFQQPSL